jgi:hypothetical protein
LAEAPRYALQPHLGALGLRYDAGAILKVKTMEVRKKSGTFLVEELQENKEGRRLFFSIPSFLPPKLPQRVVSGLADRVTRYNRLVDRVTRYSRAGGPRYALHQLCDVTQSGADHRTGKANAVLSPYALRQTFQHRLPKHNHNRHTTSSHHHPQTTLRSFNHNILTTTTTST